ncbi:hypothetical protein BK742_04220 [Bacillus thuringiensis serovar pingluonsis]|uniref:Uncharacterized protein n=5 Tax=Bacillus cereus group TaxID=86661 RepID=A0A243BGE1_BACTU|nr:hypothetical protein EGX95_00855 [Bacillus sp. FDAARGOS_527]EAA8523114.1 hypothetical protein [Salmonella enterica subsp. enterica serovar Give]EAA8724768.1 hypothetical protein [Salmonella enterica subsp. enterica serovar Saintpaul]KAA0794896.1 hypothetical protein DN393_00505 [Bacillus sp. BPN334]KAA8471748.1 hypothetical protein FYW06_29625 [Bacillus paranthracis]KAB7629223.1 hypothetical protein GBN96_29440 [Bacillus sp. B4-WWTP-NA-D-NA-NA]MBL2049336.1 hypothetical protein [Klebsiella 
MKLGKPYVICASSRMTVKSNDVAEGKGYKRKQKPLAERKQESIEICITERILSSLRTNP